MTCDRIGIVGPGAMGLLHAIHLARAGLPVTLLDHRKSRARRLSGGVMLIVPARGDRDAETIHAQIPCRRAASERTPFDLLIFTVKAWATARAAADAAHLIAPHTVLLSLQNGLGNVEALQAHQQPALVLAGVTTSGATLIDEHTVVERGLGTITLGSPAGNDELAEEVAEAGVYRPVNPGRLMTAGKKGIPQVVSTGGLEYLCFGPRESIPPGLRRRKTVMHNPYNANVKLSRSEMALLGSVMAERLNAAAGPAAVLVPLRGWSVYGAPGGALYDGAGNRIFLKALKDRLRKDIVLREIDAHINDDPFVDACVNQLIAYMEEERS